MADNSLLQSTTHELRKLLIDGVLGFYNSVEVTELFAIPSKGSRPVNVLTILVAEHREKPNFNQPQFLTSDLIKLKKLKGWAFGLKRYLKPVEDILDDLDKLIISNSWGSLNVPELEYHSKQFITPDSMDTLPLNNVLKNNYHNGSYVAEWFDHKKDLLLPILQNPPSLQELNSYISEIIPLNVSSISDRLGNYIFQIPVKIIQTRITSQHGTEDLDLHIAWHHGAKSRQLEIQYSRENSDKSIEDYAVKAINENEKTIHLPSTSSYPYKAVIWDSINEVILSATQPSSFIKQVVSSMHSMQEEARIIPNSNTQQERVATFTAHDSIIGSSDKSKRIWTEKRIYNNDKKQLQRKLEFIQYNPKNKPKHQERDRALKDVRALINKFGIDGVYLWDPYLSAKDIFSTLFYNPSSNAPMRAITHLKLPPIKKEAKCSSCATSIPQQIINKKNTHLNEMNEEFVKLQKENVIGLNLEFRTPIAGNGWGFHDRFLIFPFTHSEPLAWSLGTSVNSLGEEHHILQKVGDAQLIVDAFNELWEEISKPECLIWSSNEK